MFVLELLGVFVFGTIIGSFLNVLILRLPQEETLNGHSHCVHCKHPLNALDLVPLFSFISLAGKCRYCKKPISKRYFLIELVTALLFSLSFLIVAPFDLITALIFLKYCIVSSIMIVVFMIDLENFLILDSVVFFSAVKLLIINLVIDYVSKARWADSLTFNGILAASGLYLFFATIHYISKGRWMGFGDVKFAIVLGLATVFPNIIITLFLSFLIGTVVGLVLLGLRLKHLSSEVPFGTFLAISCIITMLYGDRILNWYLTIIGLKIYV